MLYLPDTNVWICHLNPAPSMVKIKLEAKSCFLRCSESRAVLRCIQKRAA